MNKNNETNNAVDTVIKEEKEKENKNSMFQKFKEGLRNKEEKLKRKWEKLKLEANYDLLATKQKYYEAKKVLKVILDVDKFSDKLLMLVYMFLLISLIWIIFSVVITVLM